MAEVELPTNDIRFQMELEFIQCLASPAYLNCEALCRFISALLCVAHACLSAACSPGDQPVL